MILLHIVYDTYILFISYISYIVSDHIHLYKINYKYIFNYLNQYCDSYYIHA